MCPNRPNPSSTTISHWQKRFSVTAESQSKIQIIPEYDEQTLNDKTLNIACAYAPNAELKMLNKPIPKAEFGEVVLHVRATGICGSDVHFWKHGHIGDDYVHQPCGAGHESAGEIIEIGEGVSAEWKVGDRVAIEAGIPCGLPSCQFCLKGRYNACPKMIFFSSPPIHGTLTRFHAHPAAWLHRLPDNVSYQEGALCEPLAVALAGLQRAAVSLGDPVLICGAGPIGLVTLLSAHAAGCFPIIITDLVASRLEIAKSLVPTVQTLKIEREWSSSDIAEKVKSIGGDAPVEVALECTGIESSITAAIYSVNFGGKVFVIGQGPTVQSYPVGYCSMNEIDLQFQFRYAHQYPKALRLVSGGLINLKPLITHRFPLEKAKDAFAVAGDYSQNSIKVQILD
ncbi:hypothetical protein I302_106406 [Kwoniella bestiolae CBS 10118]|uniref:L-arabinitol 4-dehydrogenase n=1 Tax=Kwoniella bestiolae CBS 10118 TaxID=1296100 RepID=A0A1B9G1H9_9TREE|nr:chlorophyll synthesis pathway protein BchC [Kwoniella bestiolae CBS 10118]OCF24875.1 chlorophyll synthesis pathway protein BchC [Kwoniella bestiolae CBS 10118]